jgi:acyl dehydratase
MVRVIEGADGLKDAVGQHLGYSDWVTVDQARVDRFAESTGDRQWIHVDPEKAATSPFGGTIAHGFLTLSLIPGLQDEIFRLRGAKFGVNYGANRIRFPAPVPVGSRVRLAAVLAGVEILDRGGVQAQWTFTVEIEGTSKPACVAELVFRYTF